MIQQKQSYMCKKDHQRHAMPSPSLISKKKEGKKNHDEIRNTENAKLTNNPATIAICLLFVNTPSSRIKKIATGQKNPMAVPTNISS